MKEFDYGNTYEREVIYGSLEGGVLKELKRTDLHYGEGVLNVSKDTPINRTEY